MADDIDRAQKYDELYRDQALTAHFNRLRAGAGLQPINFGKTIECVDCGEPIAPKRLQANPSAIRCIACETQYERTQGRRS